MSRPIDYPPITFPRLVLAAVLVLVALGAWSVVDNIALPKGADKVGHVAGFVALMLGGLWLGERWPAIRRHRTLWVSFCVIATASLAAWTEWYQQWAPGREMDKLDWFFDLAGVGVGLLAYSLFWMQHIRTQRLGRK